MTPLRAVPDAVDAAIAAAAEPQPIRMRQAKVTISSTGRPCVLAIPEDASDAELAELCGWILGPLMGGLRAERVARPASRILVPG